MSVYTPVNRLQLEHYLQQYSAGKLVDFRGIEAGVENTNYFVTTTTGEYVLTLMESLPSQHLPFVLRFIEHLSLNGIACAEPLHLNSGELFGELNERPAVLMSRLNGAPLEHPDDQQASVIGTTLARMHLLAEQLEAEQQISIADWCLELGNQLIIHLSGAEQELLQLNLSRATRINWATLPQGPIHADLFPDNALFNGNQLCGLIDFYHACSAPFLYDLCVTLNAWCYDETTRQYDFDKAMLLLDSYQSQRPLNNAEQQSFAAMLQVAAMRFWLSRLRDTHFRKEGETVTRKDPQGMFRLLQLLDEQQDLKQAC